MQTEFLLYGATGYTGELIVRVAVQRGLQPILASRNAVSLKKLADELDLTYRAFGLDDPAALDAGLARYKCSSQLRCRENCPQSLLCISGNANGGRNIGHSTCKGYGLTAQKLSLKAPHNPC